MVRVMAAVIINQPETSKIDQNDLIYILHAHRTHTCIENTVFILGAKFTMYVEDKARRS